GVTTIGCSATDSYGNTGTASFTVTESAGTTSPKIIVPSNIVDTASTSSGSSETYALPTATDEYGASVTPACTSAPTVGLTSGSTFPIGVTTIGCSATDSYGNTGTASFTVTESAGTTSPKIIVPSNIVDTASTSSG